MLTSKRTVAAYRERCEASGMIHGLACNAYFQQEYPGQASKCLHNSKVQSEINAALAQQADELT